MRTVISTMMVVAMSGAAFAQAPDAQPAAGAPASPAPAVPESTTPAATLPAPAPVNNPQQLREARYQIGQMERLLEGAVEHGASVIRDRLQAVVPADMLLTENARARGFRLDGYGVFFDVEVPSLAGTLTWSLLSLDQNNLGLDAALATLRSYVEQAGSNNVNVQQALKRIELQVAPMRAIGADQQAAQPAGGVTATPVTASTGVGASAAPASGAARPAAAMDPVLSNPDEAYRTEIRDALIDAMLEHSRGLGLGPGEWLTVAARRTEDRAGLSIDTDARTVVLRVKGTDLAAFLAGQLSREEARSRIEVRVF